MGQCILTINTGSSSLKATCYEMAGAAPDDGTEAGAARVVLTASAERIGTPGSALRIWDAGGTPLYNQQGALPDHAAALQALLAWLREHGDGDGALDAIGHRVVHGGATYSAPERIDDALLVTLRELVPLDPAHLPQAIAAIEAASRAYPDVPQVACFDTASSVSATPTSSTWPAPATAAPPCWPTSTWRGRTPRSTPRSPRMRRGCAACSASSMAVDRRGCADVGYLQRWW